MADYTVKFPDGTEQKLTGLPANMSDADIYRKAVQEKGVAEGRIQTTFAGGAAKALGEDPVTTGALIGGAGVLTGGVAPAAGAAITASAPLAARLTQFLTQKHTGQNPEPPSGLELGALGALGVAGSYGPEAVTGALSGLAGKTVAHQLPATGQWVPGLKGSGVIPWAIREGSQAAAAGAEKNLVLQPPNTVRDAVVNAITVLRKLAPNFLTPEVHQALGGLTGQPQAPQQPPPTTVGSALSGQYWRPIPTRHTRLSSAQILMASLSLGASSTATRQAPPRPKRPIRTSSARRILTR
jgi:hypothetical protein